MCVSDPSGVNHNGIYQIGKENEGNEGYEGFSHVGYIY
jgi:hypothetical protein